MNGKIIHVLPILYIINDIMFLFATFSNKMFIYTFNKIKANNGIIILKYIYNI